MMEKRYYTVNEIVWDLVAKEPALVKSLDIEGKTVDVEPVEKREGVVRLTRKRKLWEIDKYKPKVTKKDRPKKNDEDIYDLREVWRPIIGYEDLYEVSNFGNIRSLGRVVRDSLGRVRNIKPKPMNPSETTAGKDNEKHGYLEVRLTPSDGGKSRNFLIHRLVAEAFLPNPDGKPMVNHLDGNKSNNRVTNLEWATWTRNNQHAYENNLKTDNKHVVRTNEEGQILGIYPSMHEASRQTGVDYRRIHVLCNTTSNSDKEGCYWDYVENYVVNESTVYFSKYGTSESIIPTREEGSGGYDFYALIQPSNKIDSEGNVSIVREQLLEKNKVNYINTGISSAMSDKYFLDFQNERSSFAKHGGIIVAGLVDSNYRGEIKLMIIPVVKDILLTSEVEKVEDYEDIVLLPYSKAVAQATLQRVPDVEVKEISYEELKNIPSERGTGGWGSSNK